MPDTSPTARFYDRLAADYHLLYADWDASVARQGAALDRVVRERLGAVADSAALLDCACGIGTQAIGLAMRGYDVVGTDISAVAVRRALVEAGDRGVRIRGAVADMRQLPFPDGRFDVVVCADNALPHLLTEADVRAALGDMRRVLRDGGLLIVSTRPYDEIRAARPTATPPSVSGTGGGRAVGFQLWEWHADGERYDLEHFLLEEQEEPGEERWAVRVRRATYWALGQRQLAGFVADSGFSEVTWAEPAATGFFQPLLVATARASSSPPPGAGVPSPPTPI
ncbi:class I SAM-dependent methyltransferase [Streptomyces geranii]|uniref:class I SAM-dependent methyltransferase n=1 Tax=Streptomyces geranii TaxID=2058923 RepID=UPI000D046F45|nr:class I SAM-dependent methyltransferase [Streptomyces geranii]